MLGVSVNVCLFVVVVLQNDPSPEFAGKLLGTITFRMRASRISYHTSNRVGSKGSSLMSLRVKNRSLVVAALAAVASFAALSTSAQIAPMGARATTMAIQGVPNAGNVNGTLYRGAQPHDSSYADLQKLGMNIVVDFRGESDEVSAEKKAVESLGMKFVNLPWNGASLPTRDQILTFFTLLRDNPDKKIFLHCQYGADRTGVMVALYRIAVDHWTSEQAIAEMKDFHYHSFMLPHLAKYVKAFPATLAADPSLAGAIPGARPAQPVAQAVAVPN